MFQNIKLKILNYILRRELLKFNYPSTLITLSGAKKMAVLFDVQGEQSIVDIKFFLKYLLSHNIDVDVWGYIGNSKSQYISTLHLNYFNHNDLDIFGIPNSNRVKLFLKKEFDVCINLSLDNTFVTKYITLLSKSRYRVGIYSNNDLAYNFMLKLKIKTLKYFIKKTIHYLELIDKNNAK